MAEPSRAVTFKDFGVEPRCYGCGKDPLRIEDAHWFQRMPPAVFCNAECWKTWRRAQADG